MFLALNTIWVWKLVPNEKLEVFFNSISCLLNEADILVLGCYEPDERCVRALREMHKPQKGKLPYLDTFEVNRGEYPDGQAFHVPASKNNLKNLAEIVVDCDGKHCFDHILSLRPSIPLVPLVYYHNVDDEPIYLTGLYSKSTVRDLCDAYSASYDLVLNDQLNSLSSNRA